MSLHRHTLPLFMVLLAAAGGATLAPIATAQDAPPAPRPAGSQEPGSQPGTPSEPVGKTGENDDRDEPKPSAEAQSDRQAEPGEAAAKPTSAKPTPAKPTPDESESASGEKAERKVIRVRRDEEGTAVAMETAVLSYHYKPGAGKDEQVQVDLIGAVHIADKSYYDELNKLFEQYDVLLYELVAPEGARVSKNAPRSNHPISAIQRGMQQMLKLDFQLDSIDYSAKNFVHADMTPEEFAQSMKDRGESFFQIFLRAFRQAMKAQAGGADTPSDIEILVALFSKDRALKLKRLMAEQFENLESQLDLFNGPDGSTLITERNKKALEVLTEQLAAGKKRVGIFYGAGHLPDMEDRLLDEFGMHRTGEKWLQAWTMEE